MKAIKHITALKARRNLGQILDEVHYQQNSYIIERAGRPMAAVVPMSVIMKPKKQKSYRRLVSSHMSPRKKQ